MKFWCIFFLTMFAGCLFAATPVVKSLKAYEAEVRKESPFVKAKKGDTVSFTIDNGKTQVAGKIVRIDPKGVLIENDGFGILYTFKRLGMEGGRFFDKRQYDLWVRVEATKRLHQAKQIQHQQQVEQQEKAKQAKAKQAKAKQAKSKNK